MIDELTEEQFELVPASKSEDSKNKIERTISQSSTNSQRSTNPQKNQDPENNFFGWLPSFSDFKNRVGSAVSEIEKLLVTEPEKPKTPIATLETLQLRNREEKRIRREKRRENLERDHLEMTNRRPRRSHSSNIEIVTNHGVPNSTNQGVPNSANQGVPNSSSEEVYMQSGSLGRSGSYVPRRTSRIHNSPVQNSRYSYDRAVLPQPPVSRSPRSQNHRRMHQSPRRHRSEEEERRLQVEEEERLSMQLIHELARTGEIDFPQAPRRRSDYPASFARGERISNNRTHTTERSERPERPERSERPERVRSYNEFSGNDDRVLELLQSFLMRRHLSDNFSDLSYESLISLHDVKKPAKNKDLMPIYVWENEKKTEDSLSEEDKCSICLGEYENGETIKTLLCFHKFHRDCIDPWLDSHNTCPVCKYKIDD